MRSAASDATTKKNVAIKKITPMAGDEWDAKHTLREIRLMRYFGQHPNVRVCDSLYLATGSRRADRIESLVTQPHTHVLVLCALHLQIASLQNLSTCAEKDELYIMMDLVDTDLHRLIQSKTKLEDAHIAYVTTALSLFAAPFVATHTMNE